MVRRARTGGRHSAGLTALVALLGLAACAPEIDRERPRFAFASVWQTKLPESPRLMENRQWWQGLGDGTLDHVITRALSASPDLVAAQARSAAAEHAVRAIPGPIQIGGGVGARRDENDPGSGVSAMRVDLSLDWLFDPGRSRDAQRLGAAARAIAAEAERDGAQLLLIAQITDSYLSLRHAQAQLALAQAEAGRLRAALSLAERLAEANEATVLDTTRARARIASLDSRMAGLSAAPQREILRLSALMGDAPGAVPAPLLHNLTRGAGQPVPRLLPNPTVPADLVRNRPDLRVAEARYDEARAGLGEARAALYPRLTLSGTIEARRTIVSGTSTVTNVASFGPSLRLPALPTTATEAAIQVSEQRVVAAHADWQKAVLNALSEVEIAMLDYNAASRAEGAALRAQGLHRQTRDLQIRATEAGEATLADLLAVEGELASAAAAVADARLSRARAFVSMNLRLGSGL